MHNREDRTTPTFSSLAEYSDTMLDTLWLGINFRRMVRTFSGAASLLLLLFVSPLSARILISELMALNGTTVMDTDYYNFSDWIELYNDSTVSVNLEGYFLSDDVGNRTKWHIPANTVIDSAGFIVIWTDGLDTALHTGFSLGGEGESVILGSPENTIIDSVTFPAQSPDRSYGRTNTNGKTWYCFDYPTPGAPNHEKSFPLSTRPADPPRFSIPGGFHDAPVTLSFTHDNPADTIRYTTDGSEPDTNSRRYDTALIIDVNRVIRAKVFSGSRFNSPTVTHTFFIKTEKTLPVVSLATKPAYLKNATYGIYTEGTNGVAGVLGDTGNYNRHWERPVNVEYFAPDHTPGFNEKAGVRIAGHVSRIANMKGLSIDFSDTYGNSEIDYRLFASRPRSLYRDFILRNSGATDLMFTHMRDGMMNLLVAGKLDIDYQAYQPVVVYINGSYWGIHNLREKLNKYYPAVNYGADPHTVDFMEFFVEPILISGNRTHYDELMNFVAEHDLGSDEALDYVHAKIDLREFIDYTIAELYFCNIDWPGNNVKMWHPGTASGRWRWILSDVECGFNLIDETAPDKDALARILSPSAPDAWCEPWSTLLFRKLMTNRRCREDFIQTSALYLSTVFDSSEVIRVIDSVRNLLAPEMPAHISRWEHVKSMTIWDDNINVLRAFARKRSEYSIKHLKDHFSLGNTSPVTVIVPPPGLGRVEINGYLLTRDTSVILLFDEVPFSVRAVAAPGQQFAQWRGAFETTSDSIRTTIHGPSVITAEFSPNGYSMLPSTVSSDLHLTAAKNPWYGSDDITVDSGATLTVDAGVMIMMADSADLRICGSLRINGEENRPVIIKPDSASGARAWGALCFTNTSDTSYCSYLRIENASFSKTAPETFPASISTNGTPLYLDHADISSCRLPFVAKGGNTTIRSSHFRSRVTCGLIHIKGGTALIEGCDLQGNDAPDVDGIDFDGVYGGIIRGNILHDFTGSNSDAIDLGENACGALVENNLIYHCTDKGVSVGQASTATIRGNTILQCGLGIGIKDSGSTAFIDRNTFHDNVKAVACFEKNTGAGGGTATVKNCIFSESIVSPTFCDPLSVLTVSYSLSTSGDLNGSNNLSGNPLFISPSTGNFMLQAASPCIDAGDPDSPPDPDSSLPDLGAHFFAQDIIINEIRYLLFDANRCGSWIELVNAGNDTVDVGGWSLSSIGNTFVTTLSPGQRIPPGGYYVLAGDQTLFRSIDETVPLLTADTPFTLDTISETLILRNVSKRVIDSVPYGSTSSWPDLDKSQTLSLECTSSDNSCPEYWHASQAGGTPGKPNTFDSDNGMIVINELQYHPSPLFDTDEWVELYNRGTRAVNVSGWILADMSDAHYFTLPVNTVMRPQEYLVLCRNRARFSEFNPDVWNTVGNFDFSFGNDGDKVRLFTSGWKLVDSLTYRTEAPWPATPGGSGPSLELINPLLDNSVQTSWNASGGHGTPGAVNSDFSTVETTVPAGAVIPMNTALLQNYPNPFTVETTIAWMISPADTGMATLALYNIKGQQIRTLMRRHLSTGRYHCTCSATSLASGTYFYRLTTKHFVKIRSFFLVR